MSDPNIITSGLSQRIAVNEQTISIEIYRLEQEKVWTLELVDEEGTSVVWDDAFPTDRQAFEVAKQTIDTEGLTLFRENAKVIQFPKQWFQFIVTPT